VDNLQGIVPEGVEVLTPYEAARALNVSTKTLQRWADKGRLRSFRTLGGHRRFWVSDIDSFLQKEGFEG